MIWSLAHAGLDGWERNSARLASPLAMVGVRRCRGLLAAAQGDLDVGLGTLEDALAQRADVAYPLERARTLLSLGTLRRQALQKKAAREALTDATGLFEQLCAPVWAEKSACGKPSGGSAAGEPGEKRRPRPSGGSPRSPPKA